jgi:lipid-binding SYLF domain-containing protein
LHSSEKDIFYPISSLCIESYLHTRFIFLHILCKIVNGSDFKTTQTIGELIMKIYQIFKIIIMVVFILGIANVDVCDEHDDTIALFQKSEVVQSFFDDCYGYAVFPTIGKGGFGIGGAFGKGKVYRYGKVTGETTLIKATVGFQMGGQAFSEIIFFQDERAYDEFTSGEFALDAEASAVAITAGAQAKAGSQGASAGASAGPATGKQAKAEYHKGMVVFVHAKGGLMYEASIGGQKFSFKPLEE